MFTIIIAGCKAHSVKVELTIVLLMVTTVFAYLQCLLAYYKGKKMKKSISYKLWEGFVPFIYIILIFHFLH